MKSADYDSGADHYSDGLWADFARQLVSADRQRQMQAHLDAGCASCASLAERLHTVARMAVNERSLVIPEELVNRAKAIAVEAPSASGWIESLTAIVAQLIQASPLDWQPAGVRSLGESAAPSGDRMLFRAADYAVYLKLEPLLGGEAAEIIGEIVNERERGENLEGIAVQMVARGQTLSETATNRFGEFLIEYPIRKNASLRFALKHRGTRIDVPVSSGLEGARQ